MRRGAWFGIASTAWALSAAFSCGGETAATDRRGVVDRRADAAGRAGADAGFSYDSGARHDAMTSTHGDALQATPERDANAEDVHSVDVVTRDGAGSSDAGDAGDGEPGCRSGSTCRGDTLIWCDGSYAPTDCATYFLNSSHPVATTCAPFSDGSLCASPVGKTCFTAKDGDAILLRCLGEAPGCVVHDDDSSECVERLPTCSGSEKLHGCSGTYLLKRCSDGQPIALDCADSPGATCGSSGSIDYCENIGIGGMCDSNADAGADQGFQRCASGLHCFASVPGSAGICQGPTEDPCTTPSRTSCDGAVLRTCFGNVRKDVDCDSHFLTATHPLRATCTTIDGAATCATPDRCLTEDDGEPVAVGCLGVAAACVGFFDGGSECQPHVGTCTGTGPTPPICLGPRRVLSCRLGQPVTLSCANIGSSGTSTCGSNGSENWCEGIGERGMCDSNADGSTEAGSSEWRCAPGLKCVGAKIVDGGLWTGGCEKVP